jgi:putative membrane protein
MQEEFMWRDKLAVDRTVLANQRTLLAFLRAAILLVASGITFLKLFAADLVLRVIGIITIPVSILIACLGVINYLMMKRKIEKVSEKIEKPV